MSAFKALESISTDSPQPKPCILEGSIPRWLSGSLIRNGPAQFEIGPDKMQHLFDGHAILHRYDFKDGKVTYQNRFIESKDRQRCQKANRIVVSEFGTLGYPDPCKSIFTRHFSYYFLDHETTDNTSVNVVQMGDELYAMTETNIMNKIDPETLETIGRVNYTELISVHQATAHPLQDADGTTYNLGSSFGSQCQYYIIKTPPGQKGDKDPASSMEVLATIPSRIPRNPSYSHSFGMTENYVILIEQPLFLSIFTLVGGKFMNSSYKDALQFRPEEKARFHIINKETGEVHPVVFTADSFFFFHTINAYEENDCIVMDVTAFPDAQIIDTLMVENLQKGADPVPYNTRRFVFPIDYDPEVPAGDNLAVLNDDCTATAVETEEGVHCEPQLFECSAELPRINPDYNQRKYHYFYGVDFAPPASGEEKLVQLVKFDLEVQTKQIWENHDPELEPGEPVFVKSPNGREEDDGVILCPVISSNSSKPSFMLVLDAATFKELGRANVPDGIKVPYTFHGHFYTPMQ